jgi:streptogramin lyase
MISRTPVSCRPTAVSASLLGGLVCVAAALALSAAPAWAAKCPRGVCAHGAASASVGAISEFPIATAIGRPTEITAGPDGNLWFTEQGGNKIGRITPSGTISEFTIPSAESEPYGIAAGHDGNLWFTEQGGNKIGRITPSGTISEFPTPRAPQPGVPGLTYGGFPQGIAAGSDGNLWFTEYVFGTIGRITPSGTISEFTIPSTESHPEGIAAGSDGNLWFTERRGEKIGRITPGGTIREFPIPAGGGQGS